MEITMKLSILIRNYFHIYTADENQLEGTSADEQIANNARFEKHY